MGLEKVETAEKSKNCTNEEIMQEIKKSNKETAEMAKKVDVIMDVLKTILTETETTKKKCEELEKKVNNQEREIISLRRQINKNNIVIYNASEKQDRSKEDIIETVKEILQNGNVAINNEAINECFRIGKGTGTRPIKVSLTSSLTKQKIMNNKEVFRNLNTPIAHDRSKEDREYGKRIYNCLKTMKNFDINVGTFKGKINFKGKMYELVEAEELIKNKEEELRKEEKEESDNRKRKAEEMATQVKDKLEDFRFRPRSRTSSTSQ